MNSFISSIVRLYNRYYTALLILLILLLLVYAWTNRFMEDDAFISFRYADNLLHGNGLVWNKGEYVEGYTNFLWTLLICVCMWFGGNPAVSSQILGICFFIGSLLTMYYLLTMIFQSRNVGLVGTLILGSNYTFSAFATSGLETQMQAALLLGTTYFWANLMLSGEHRHRVLLSASLCMAAAVLTRPDSILLVAIFLASGTVQLIAKGGWRRETWIRLFLYFLPVVSVVAGWLLWKIWYYGDILPNTFYAKVASPTSGWRGIYYIYSFFLSYLLFPFIVILFFAVRQILRRDNRYLQAILVALFCWGLYMIVTGGDHMEFRFFVPVLPLMVVVIMWILFSYFHHPLLRIFFVFLILTGTVYHAVTFADSIDPAVTIYPLQQYGGYCTLENEQWSAIGKTLYQAFPDRRDVRIATTAAGAIPFYSRLPAVDMLGITDPWVARHGDSIGTTPGHQRIAPMSYIAGRGVNLLISHPVIVDSATSLDRIPLAPMDSIVSFHDATFLLIPIDTVHKCVVMYLIRNPVIDKAIADNHWGVVKARIK